MSQFIECDSCAAKPGTPVLCDGCLKNRNLINKFKQDGFVLHGRLADKSEELEAKDKLAGQRYEDYKIQNKCIADQHDTIRAKDNYLTGLSEELCDKPDASFDEMLIAISKLKKGYCSCGLND